MHGHCTCRGVSYRLTSSPLIVHCCHCTWCQRESGSAFAVNAMIETDRMIVDGEVEVIDTPSNSGKGQKISRCPTCKIALWSNYSGAGPTVRFVRAGTLAEPLAPDVHNFTSTKRPWVVLPEGARAFAEYYDSKQVWSADSLARRAALFG